MGVTADRRPSADEVVAGLEDLAAHLVWPEEPDLGPAVRARLLPTPQQSSPPRWWSATGKPRWASAVAAVVALVLLGSALLTASPSARRAVADFLGLRGVEIELDGGTTSRPPLPAGDTLQLGRSVTLAEARVQAGFPLLVPAGGGALGPPDGVYVDESVAGGAVSVVYRSRPGFPGAGPSGVGVLLTQFRASVDEGALRKVVPRGSQVEAVSVSGQKGYWFEGSPHLLFFTDAQGRFVEDRSRLAGNTLIWEQGDITVRLESALSRDEAVRLAEDLTHVEGKDHRHDRQGPARPG